MTEYARGGTVFTLIADALAVTLNVAECAVCVFEAASRASGGIRPDESYVPSSCSSVNVATYSDINRWIGWISR